jgi:hypothetical protein
LSGAALRPEDRASGAWDELKQLIRARDEALERAKEAGYHGYGALHDSSAPEDLRAATRAVDDNPLFRRLKSEAYGLARQELRSEEAHGADHFWANAWSALAPDERGVTATTHFPRGIRRRSSNSSGYVLVKETEAYFGGPLHARRARRWARRQERRYDRYVRRIIRLGLYDEHGYS